MAFLQQGCFKISAMLTFSWVVLLIAADLQVCSVYSFRTDIFMKSTFIYLLIESIAAALNGLLYVMNKALVSVCTLVLRRFKNSLKQFIRHNVLLWYACPIGKTVRLLCWFWMFKNMIRWKCNYICNCHPVYWENIYSVHSLVFQQQKQNKKVFVFIWWLAIFPFVTKVTKRNFYIRNNFFLSWRP